MKLYNEIKYNATVEIMAASSILILVNSHLSLWLDSQQVAISSLRNEGFDNYSFSKCLYWGKQQQGSTAVLSHPLTSTEAVQRFYCFSLWMHRTLCHDTKTCRTISITEAYVPIIVFFFFYLQRTSLYKLGTQVIRQWGKCFCTYISLQVSRM